MRSSYWIALALAISVSAWIASGWFAGPPAPLQSKEIGSLSPAAAGVPEVRVRTQTAEVRTSEIVVTGRTAASRKVELRAETGGRIVEIAAARGAFVERNDTIVRIAMDDRAARISKAQALAEQRQIEFDAANKLRERGFRAEVKVAEARANLEAARAALERIVLDIEHTEIRAPFDAVVDARPVEIGDFVNLGDPVATVVDLDPILVIGAVAERAIAKVTLGMAGEARLVTGQRLRGKVRYISSVAAARTRTFRIELEVPNPGRTIPEGMTSELVLPYAKVRAHHVSPASLTLSVDGVVGVKTVNNDHVVEFHRAEIIGQSADGMWLGGLPETITLITVGQEFVLPGQAVKPIAQGTGGGP